MTKPFTVKSGVPFPSLKRPSGKSDLIAYFLELQIYNFSSFILFPFF